jgi:hypothetical protein
LLVVFLVAVWVLVIGVVVGLLKVRWLLHLLCAVLSILMLLSFVFVLKGMSMISVYSIFFVVLLLIIALLVFMLGEMVGLRCWAVILVGLVGVFVVLRFTGEGVFGWVGLVVVVAVVGYAFSAILVRVMHCIDSVQAMVFWMLVMIAVGVSLLALLGWVLLYSNDTTTETSPKQKTSVITT